LRPGQPGDAGALALLDSLVNPSPWSANQFAAACAAKPASAERALVVHDGERLLGFVVYSLVQDETCIHNIAVHPSSQGRGLGQLLLAAALAESGRGGAARCYLEVRASNAAARGLYQKLGFQLDGIRKNYYFSAAGREDALLMSLQLAGQEN
jgi:ribosomal-protein-alanine N-acetyltransferase